ncbi:uncharacterized protein LOC121861410 isoform X2 [Homarus americanus]|uniref:uncharacterized protein LOC121861410 isoform X2 n=1 Tax=Homarus americanus TaxID=6706 RepID=UPI001C460193|nr:uncharacterized protein LOC121861410 isoform X2 [Homarus americanus]
MSDHSVVYYQAYFVTEELLPVEIWEIILKYLQTSDLLTASCVSRAWRHLARRICRERCHYLPPRLLAELTHEYYVTHYPKSATPPTLAQDANSDVVADGDTKDEVMEELLAKCQERVDEPEWLDISRMSMQTAITSIPDDCNMLLQVKRVTHLTSAGRFVVVVSHGEDENTCIIRLFGKAGQECCVQHIKGRILRVCAMEMPETPPILAMCVNKYLKCYLVGPQLHSLTPLSVTPVLSVDSRLCCDGNTVIVSQMMDEIHLAIYQANFIPQHGRIELVHIGRITTSSPPVYWDLWNGFVTTIVSGGHVSSYTVSGNLIAESPLYKDLRYPNPTLLSRGLIFASTITSRTLLSYWHMDRERDYWLVGESILTSWIQRGSQDVGNASWITGTQVKSSSNNMNPQEGNITDGTARSLPYSEPASSCILTLAKVRVGATLLLEVIYWSTRSWVKTVQLK